MERGGREINNTTEKSQGSRGGQAFLWAAVVMVSGVGFFALLVWYQSKVRDEYFRGHTKYLR